MQGARPDRMSQQVQRVLAEALATKVADPRLRLVTITDVEMSQDLRSARVYYALIDDSPAQKALVEQGLDKAAGFLRREMAHALNSRYVPELFFRFDPGGARGARIAQLLRDTPTASE